MLCAAIDIGSNSARVLVAEPIAGQLTKMMEQRAYTRIDEALGADGAITAEKIDEVCEVVATQVRLARGLGAETIRAVATAAVREAGNGEEAAAAISRAAGVPVEILSEEQEGRLAFIGATKTLGHPVAGKVGVVDVGGGSTEVVIGTVPGGGEEVLSWKVGSGALADAAHRLRSTLGGRDPQGPRSHRRHLRGGRDRAPGQAVAVGGSATSLRRLVGAVLEYETLERGIRVLCGDPAAEVARRFELDPQRVRILTTASCSWRRSPRCSVSRYQIGEGGLEGVILDLSTRVRNGSSWAQLLGLT